MKFIDARELLARHESKRFRSRSLVQIRGGVFHQTAGGDDPYATARYHVGPNHVSQTGCPALLYTFYVRQDGEIYFANDLEAVTWSQGGKGSPVPGTDANTNFLAIVLGGAFDGDGWNGKAPGPTYLQLHAALCLWGHLTGAELHPDLPSDLYDVLPCRVEALYGHHNFGKPACPGEVMTSVVESVRSYLPASSSTSLDSDKDWQEALVEVGYDIGSWGADGVWGNASRQALADFQRDYGGLTVDGIRGKLSEAALISAKLKSWHKPD